MAFIAAKCFEREGPIGIYSLPISVCVDYNCVRVLLLKVLKEDV